MGFCRAHGGAPELYKKSRAKEDNEEEVSPSAQTIPLLAVSQKHIRIYSLPDNVYLTKIHPLEGKTIRTAHIKDLNGAKFLVTIQDSLVNSSSGSGNSSINISGGNNKLTMEEEEEKIEEYENILVVYSIPDFHIVCELNLEHTTKVIVSNENTDNDTVSYITSSCELFMISLLKERQYGLANPVEGRAMKISLVDKSSIKLSSKQMPLKLASTISTSTKSLRSVFTKKSSQSNVEDLPTLFSKKLPPDQQKLKLKVEDSIFRETALSLAQRGERINELMEKTEELHDGSKRFYEAARKLNAPYHEGKLKKKDKEHKHKEHKEKSPTSSKVTTPTTNDSLSRGHSGSITDNGSNSSIKSPTTTTPTTATSSSAASGTKLNPFDD